MRAVLAALLLATIFSAAPGAAATSSAVEVQRSIERSLPGVSFHLEERVRLGRFKLGLARWFLRFSDEADEDVAIVRHVNRVEITSWRLARGSDARVDARALGRAFSEDGWHLMVTESDGDAHEWVMIRQDEEAIDGLLVVSLEHDELSVVAMDGDVERMIEVALADDGESVLALAGGARDGGS